MSLYDQLLNVENKSKALPKLLDKLTIGNEILSNCTLELTPLCNFRCKFCYSRLTLQDVKERNTKIKDFSEWKRYIDELSEMKCMTIAFTGGECTLHPDFVSLYKYAYEKGFIINVFTNASHITNELLDTFRQMPPSRIYATIYGNSPETYERVTGNADYCKIVKENLKLLASMKFDIVVQGTFVVDNVYDAEELFDFATSLGCEFRYTNQLQTYGNCTPEVKADLLAANDVMKLASEKILIKKKKLAQQAEAPSVKYHIAPVKDDKNSVGITCNAGKNSCFIRYDGMMMPCNSFDAFCVDTNNRSLKESFDKIKDWANKYPRIKECIGCIHSVHCTSCVAAHYNDTHQFGVPSPNICFKIIEPEKAEAERKFFDEHGYIEV